MRKIIISLGIAVFVLSSFSFEVFSAITERKEVSGAISREAALRMTGVNGVVSEQVLSAGDGQVIRFNGDAVLPKSVTASGRIDAFSGYIVEFAEAPLMQKFSELSGAAVDAVFSDKALSVSETKLLGDGKVNEVSARIKDGLRNQQVLIEREQVKAEQVIKGVSKKAQIKRRYLKAVNGFSIDGLSEAEAKKLEEKGYVVSPNYSVRSLLMESVPLIGGVKVWEGIKDSSGASVSGKGVRVGVIDTGIDYTHPDFGACDRIKPECKVAGGYDFINWDFDPKDDHGHGTHVASIIAAKGAISGVAPDATLYAYKVLDANGNGYYSSIIAGIDRAIDPNLDGDFSDRLDVINLSLGGYGDPSDPMARAVDRAVDAGIVVVVAAGNSGEYGDRTIMSPGVSRKVITVGATDKKDDLAYFSSKGPVVYQGKAYMKPDIAAPGFSICAARMPSFEPWIWNSEYSKCLDDKHVLLHGTSMAAPHVAGAAALLKQKYPGWTSRQVKYALRDSANDLFILPQGDGAGRLDVFAAAGFKEVPPIAELEPLPLLKRGVLPIIGRLNTRSFQKYVLEYSSAGSESYTLIKEVNVSPKLASSERLGELDLDSLPDGAYVIRLTLYDKSGKKAVDHGYTEVKKVEITFPLNSDVLKGKVKIAFSLKTPIGSTPVYAYGAGPNPEKWIAFSGPIFDATTLSDGVYTARVQVLGKAGGIGFSEERVTFYLDSSLRKGFPKRVAYDPAPDGSRYHIGEFAPLVADLDGNNTKEIVLVRQSRSPKLVVYRNDGMLLWQASVGSPGDGPIGEPLIVDMNGDGKKEIFVVSPAVTKDFSTAELYSFSADGSPFADFAQPVKVPWSADYALIAGDLNRDGLPEIVMQPDGGDYANEYKRTMTIIGQAGKIIKQWGLLGSSGFEIGHPVLGNFDDDEDLEIVTLSPVGFPQFEDWRQFNATQIDIFNMDGTRVSAKYPIRTLGYSYASPAVADVNGDGKDDLVIATAYSSDVFPDLRYGGVYVYDRGGAILPGFPVEKGRNFLSSPAIFDMEGDGKLEIAASELGFVTFVFDSAGQIKTGWPQLTTWNDYGGLVVADVDGDQKKDVVTTAGDAWFTDIARGGETLIGGVYGWNNKGEQVSGFPRPTEVDAQAPAVITDLDNNNKLDIVATSNWDADVVNGKYKMRGSVYVWELPKKYEARFADWPMRHRDEWKTGRYAAFATSSPSSSLPVLDLQVVNMYARPGQPSQSQNFEVDIVVKNNGQVQTPPDPKNPIAQSVRVYFEITNPNDGGRNIYNADMLFPTPILPNSTGTLIVSNSGSAMSLNFGAGIYDMRAEVRYSNDPVAKNNSYSRKLTVVDRTARVAVAGGSFAYVTSTTGVWLGPFSANGATSTLALCGRFYSAAVSARPYKLETVSVFGSQIQTEECVQRALYADLDASSPVVTYVSPGMTDVVFGKFSFRPSELEMKASGIQIRSDLGAEHFRDIRVYDGDILLGATTSLGLTGSGYSWDRILFKQPISITNASKVLTIMARISPTAIGRMRIGTSGLIAAAGTKRYVTYGVPVFASTATIMNSSRDGSVTSNGSISWDSAERIAYFIGACTSSGGVPVSLEAEQQSTYVCDRKAERSSMAANLLQGFLRLFW